MKINALNLLQIITGYYYGDMDGIYKCYRHLTGTTVFTHSLPHWYECFLPLLRKHFTDQAKFLDAASITKNNYSHVLADFIEHFGDEFTLPTGQQLAA